MLDFLKNGQGEILKLFFINPEQEYYFREIGQKLNKEPSYYQRPLDKLVSQGILKDERKGNMRFFKLNKEHPLYEEIKSIVAKTLGIEYKLKNLVNQFAGLDSAFLFGSIAKKAENSQSDIDLLLIGSVDQNLLIKDISKIEGEIKREINYHIYSQPEILKKLKKNDSFFVNIFSAPLISLKGDPYEFVRLIKQ